MAKAKCAFDFAVAASCVCVHGIFAIRFYYAYVAIVATEAQKQFSTSLNMAKDVVLNSFIAQLFLWLCHHLILFAFRTKISQKKRQRQREQGTRGRTKNCPIKSEATELMSHGFF